MVEGRQLRYEQIARDGNEFVSSDISRIRERVGGADGDRENFTVWKKLIDR